jgi:hypothetical protein
MKPVAAQYLITIPLERANNKGFAANGNGESDLGQQTCAGNGQEYKAWASMSLRGSVFP